MNDLAALLTECKLNPFDDDPRLVLADYLEEHGEAADSIYLHLPNGGELTHGNETLTCCWSTRTLHIGLPDYYDIGTSNNGSAVNGSSRHKRHWRLQREEADLPGFRAESVSVNKSRLRGIGRDYMDLIENVRNYPVLTPDECTQVAATIHEMRPHWIRRNPVAPFFTLGIASYVDATREPQRSYHDPSYQMNAVLAANLSWLYVRLLDSLTQLLNENVAYRPSCALPGFHIALWSSAFENWEASVHQDLQYELLDWDPAEKPDFRRPLSFTLAIALPRHGGGLNVWDVTHDELEGLSPDDRHRKIMATRMQYHPYQVGQLAIHSGHKVHQIARTKKEQDGDERVTLQGHGIHCHGGWQLYW